MMNTLKGINSKSDEWEDWIRDLEDKVGENIQLEEQKEKNFFRGRQFKGPLGQYQD